MNYFRTCVFFLMLSLVALAACGKSNSSGTNEDKKITADLTAMVREIVAGSMAQTDAGLQDKVFPHISDKYNYAGLDKQGFMDKSIEDLDENPPVRIDKYDLTVAIEIAPGRQTATARTTNDIQATIPAHGTTPFDLSLTSTDHGEMHFAQEDGGVWRVVGGAAVYKESLAGGGDASRAVDLKNVAVDAQTAAPHQNINVAGTIDLPQISAGEQLQIVVGLSWGDDRNNAQIWWDSQDASVVMIDVADKAGQAYDLKTAVPADGEPGGLTIPSALPRGVDAVAVSVGVATGTQTAPLRYDVHTFSLPFQPLANADLCLSGATDGADGVWKVNVTKGSFGQRVLFELLDLAQVNTNLYGAAAYVALDSQNKWSPVVFDVTGSVAGDTISFQFAKNGVSISYQATLSGTQMLNGTLTFNDGAGHSSQLPFTAEKLNNRCEGLREDSLGGKNISAISGGYSDTLKAEWNNFDLTLVGSSRTFTGYQYRNLAVGVDESQYGEWLGLAFYDMNGGYASLVNQAVPVDGTCTVQK